MFQFHTHDKVYSNDGTECTVIKCIERGGQKFYHVYKSVPNVRQEYEESQLRPAEKVSHYTGDEPGFEEDISERED